MMEVCDRDLDKFDVADMLNDELGDASGFLEISYRELCSNHAQEMIELQDRDDSDTETLLNFMSRFPETQFLQYLNAEAPVLRKNATRAQQLRDQGNKAYEKANNTMALHLYTQSVRFSPYQQPGLGVELALAYANRSAVLVQAKEWRLALQDIDLSFSAGYSSDLHYKLLERKAKILMEMKDFESAKNSFQDCISSLPSAKLEEDKRENLKLTLTNLINSLQDKKDQSPSDKSKKSAFPNLSSPNPKFPALSSSVDIKFGSSTGRFAVATRDIALGELVCVEHPPVAFLHEETSGINCSNCFRLSLAPLPSPTCTQTVFCSTICQDQAMASYHVVESKFMDVLFQNGLKKKEWFLALRAITQKPLQFFLDIRERLSKDQHNINFGVTEEKDFVYNSSDYNSLYNLVGHHEQWDFQSHAYKAFFALFFIRCLQKSKFFLQHQSPNQSLGPVELYIGRLIVHLMEVATMNAHEIGQLELSGSDNWLLGNTTSVGCALEPTLVLLNHSCDPAVYRLNIGTSTYCFACRPLSAGDEVTNCYTYSYDVTPKIERAPPLLTKYKFQCMCVACKENWPVSSFLPKAFNDVEPNKLKISDPSSLQQKMAIIQQVGAKIHRLQQEEDYDSAMGLYSQFYNALHDLIVPPHQFYVIARRSYATCLWVKHGNKVRRKN